MYLNKNFLSTSLCGAYEPYFDIYGGLPSLTNHILKPKNALTLNIASFPHPYTVENQTKAKEYINYFLSLLDNHEYLYLSAEFKSYFKQPQYDDNYGLRISFWENNNTGRKISVIFDLKSFNGNPYEYKYYTQQGALINIEYLRDRVAGISEIVLFYEGNQSNLSIDDYIEVNHLIVDFVLSGLLSDSQQYTNTIIANQGYELSAKQDSILLKPELSFNNYTLDQTCISESKWFCRNNDINKKNSLYEPLVGQGWQQFYPQQNDNIKQSYISITLNENKEKNYKNHVILPNDFYCEEEVMCIFKYNKHDSWFKSDPFIVFNRNNINDLYSFEIKSNINLTGKSIDDFSATLSLIYDFDCAKFGYEKLFIKWYWKENNWLYSNENHKANKEEGLLSWIDFSDEENKNFIGEIDEEMEIDVASKLNILDKLAFWEGKFEVYCDIFGVRTDAMDIEYLEFLAHRSFTYEKTISLSEFTILMDTYIKGINQKTGSNSTETTTACKYCLDNKIFTDTKWQRWCSLEEMICVLYRALSETIELSEKDRLNPYWAKLREFWNQYNKESMSMAAAINKDLWQSYIDKQYLLKDKDAGPTTYLTKEDATYIFYKVFFNELND